MSKRAASRDGWQTIRYACRGVIASGRYKTFLATSQVVGGTGADDIRGNSGGDLLIAGFTTYDQSIEDLLLIRAEWTSQNSYLDRVNNLRSGSGSILTGQAIQLLGSGSHATVFDDDDEDQLRGGSGHDWYFAQLSNKRDGDRVWKSKSEFLDLLDD